MNLTKKKQLTPYQQEIAQLTKELRNCEKLLKQTEALFHMTVDEHLIEARIYEMKSLAKVQDHLISCIRQLTFSQKSDCENDTVTA